MKREAAVLVFARLTNYAVMLLSPLFLVRLLSVEQFGEYREFMLYAGILQWVAGFAINDSLLYFVPRDTSRVRSWIRSSILLVAVLSSVITGIVLLVDVAMNGSLLRWFWLPLSIYVLAFTNFDFWESLWLAQKHVKKVLVYTTARMLARMAAVVIVTAVWHDVKVAVWTLVTVECLRLGISVLAWIKWDRAERPMPAGLWVRQQWTFCVSTGLSSLVIVLNRNLGSVLIARAMGPAALARFTVATYPEPVVSALTKAVFTVSLPELVRRRETEGNASLEIWKRSVSWVCAAVLPALAIVLVTARDLVVIAFGEDYAGAAPLLQAFLLVMARNMIDFSVPMRAIGETRPLLWSNACALLVNGVGLAFLMPLRGEIGVVLAFALAMAVEPVWLAPLVAKRYEQKFSELLHWGDLGKTLLASATAAVVAFYSGLPLVDDVIRVLVMTGAGMIAYVCSLFLMRSRSALEALDAARSRMHIRR